MSYWETYLKGRQTDRIQQYEAVARKAAEMGITLKVGTMRIGVYADRALTEQEKAALGLVFKGRSQARDGFGYRYRLADG